MTRYKRERRILEDAPDVQGDDLMSLADAARYLGVRIPTLDGYMSRGDLATIVDESAPRTARKAVRRFVLRSEIEALQRRREEHGSDEPEEGEAVDAE